MRAFRKESPWFYDTESLKIVITGTRLAEKNAEGITVKLTEKGKPAVYVSFRAIQPVEITVS